MAWWRIPRTSTIFPAIQKNQPPWLVRRFPSCTCLTTERYCIVYYSTIFYLSLRAPGPRHPSGSFPKCIWRVIQTLGPGLAFTTPHGISPLKRHPFLATRWKKARLLRGFGHWSSLHLGMCTIFPSKDQGKKHIIPQKDTQIFPYSLCVGFDFLFFLGLVQTRACHQGDLYKLNSGKLNHDLRYPGMVFMYRGILPIFIWYVNTIQYTFPTFSSFWLGIS